VKVSRGNESDGDGGRGDASYDGNGKARTAGANAKQGNRDRPRATGGDQIQEHCVAREVTALDLDHLTDEVASGDAEEVECGGDDGGGRDGGFNVDLDTQDSGNRELAPIVNEVANEMAPFEDDYDNEMLEEQLVGDVIRAYSNGGEVDWEAEDEMEFDDDAADDGGFVDDVDDGEFVDDADDGEFVDGSDGGGMTPLRDHGKMEKQDLVNRHVVLDGWRCQEEEAEEEEEEREDAADIGDFIHGADEGGMTPVQDHDRMEMLNLVNHRDVLGGWRCQEEEAEEEGGEEEEGADIKGGVEQNGEVAPGSSQPGLRVVVLDSDEEVKVLENVSTAPTRKASAQPKLPTIPSCVAWRTRSSWGINQDRLSYNTYFEELSDEPKEDDDDTEIELDEEEDNNDDDSSDTYDKDEEDEEEEEEEEEAERRKLKNRIYTSDDDMIDSTVIASRCEDNTVRSTRYEDHTIPTSRYDIEWEEVEDAKVDIFQPISFKKATRWHPVVVDNDTFTEQQKQSRFTWELERRKKLKLGMMKTHPLYEKNLDSDSSSSGSEQIKRNGFKGDQKVESKKKHLSSKSGKKSSHATLLKRQSLMKLLIDKMSGDKKGESLPFDLNPQLQFVFKEMHPLVFSFGDEDLVPADKPEQDGAIDMLWADFDFALESENIGTYYDDEVHFVFCRCVVLVFISFLLI
jgi:DNA repair and recombination RAD54-like protein